MPYFSHVAYNHIAYNRNPHQHADFYFGKLLEFSKILFYLFSAPYTFILENFYFLTNFPV